MTNTTSGVAASHSEGHGRTVRYRVIAAELGRRLAGAIRGQLLPSESELAAEFGASRVTVRRALEVLRDEGVVESRQGLGWLVRAAAVPQRLDDLVTIEAQLEERGIRAERRVVEFAFVAASPEVAEALGCDQVLRVRRLNLADGEPFGVVTVWCPATLGAPLSRRDVEERPFYDLLGVRVVRVHQRIGAAPASPGDARLLGVPIGSPVLMSTRVSFTAGNVAVLMSEQVFPAHRTEYVAELPNTAPGAASLRLVN
jgi:GntR family transcriptional regulator